MATTEIETLEEAVGRAVGVNFKAAGKLVAVLSSAVLAGWLAGDFYHDYEALHARVAAMMNNNRGEVPVYPVPPDPADLDARR